MKGSKFGEWEEKEGDGIRWRRDKLPDSVCAADDRDPPLLNHLGDFADCRAFSSCVRTNRAYADMDDLCSDGFQSLNLFDYSGVCRWLAVTAVAAHEGDQLSLLIFIDGKGCFPLEEGRHAARSGADRVGLVTIQHRYFFHTWPSHT